MVRLETSEPTTASSSLSGSGVARLVVWRGGDPVARIGGDDGVGEAGGVAGAVVDVAVVQPLALPIEFHAGTAAVISGRTAGSGR